MLSDISKCRRSKKCIHHCMKQNIRIRVSKKSLFIRNLHSAKD